jgi:hypothetical protein
MKITIEPTRQIVEMGNGSRARRWLGVTDKGTKCDVFVPIIRVANIEDNTAFERELIELPPPFDEPIDLRMLI